MIAATPSVVFQRTIPDCHLPESRTFLLSALCNHIRRDSVLCAKPGEPSNFDLNKIVRNFNIQNPSILCMMNKKGTTIFTKVFDVI